MMQTCNKCPEWGQWRMQKPVRDDKDKITGWELIALLCGTHKAEQENLEENSSMRFNFVGAIPCL